MEILVFSENNNLKKDQVPQFFKTTLLMTFVQKQYAQHERGNYFRLLMYSLYKNHKDVIPKICIPVVFLNLCATTQLPEERSKWFMKAIRLEEITVSKRVHFVQSCCGFLVFDSIHGNRQYKFSSQPYQFHTLLLQVLEDAEVHFQQNMPNIYEADNSLKSILYSSRALLLYQMGFREQALPWAKLALNELENGDANMSNLKPGFCIINSALVYGDFQIFKTTYPKQYQIVKKFSKMFPAIELVKNYLKSNQDFLVPVASKPQFYLSETVFQPKDQPQELDAILSSLTDVEPSLFMDINVH